MIPPRKDEPLVEQLKWYFLIVPLLYLMIVVYTIVKPFNSIYWYLRKKFRNGK